MACIVMLQDKGNSPDYAPTTFVEVPGRQCFWYLKDLVKHLRPGTKVVVYGESAKAGLVYDSSKEWHYTCT
jgi:hypothetical protein